MNKLYLGTSPIDEDCVQLIKGNTTYLRKMIAEARVFIKQLEKQFPKHKNKFKIEKCYHDFGPYIEVIFEYDDTQYEQAIRIEEEMWSSWHEEIIADLIDIQEISNGNSAKDEMTLKAIEYLEEKGYTVFGIEDFDGLEKVQTEQEITEISVEEAMAGRSIEDLMFDSIVPACCKYGCSCEPDGHCQHNNPSVLLAMGVI